MSKKKYLLIIFAITLICIIAGLWKIIDSLKGFGYQFEYQYSSSDGTTQNCDTETQGFGKVAVEDIEIDADIADVYFYYGSQLEVKSIYPKEYLPTVSLKNGVLSIKQKGSPNSRIDININSDEREEPYTINVVIPKDTVVSNINFKAGYGDVHVDDVEATELEINRGEGDTELANCKLGKVHINGGHSDVSIDAEIDDIDLDCASGDYEIRGNNKTIKASSADGDIEIQGGFDSIDAKTNAGDITISSNNEIDMNKINAEAIIGNVIVNGKEL